MIYNLDKSSLINNVLSLTLGFYIFKIFDIFNSNRLCNVILSELFGLLLGLIHKLDLFTVAVNNYNIIFPLAAFKSAIIALLIIILFKILLKLLPKINISAVYLFFGIILCILYLYTNNIPKLYLALFSSIKIISIDFSLFKSSLPQYLIIILLALSTYFPFFIITLTGLIKRDPVSKDSINEDTENLDIKRVNSDN